MHSRNMEWKLLKAQLYSYSRTWSRIKRTKKWESRTPNWCNKKMWVASFFLLFNQHGSSSLLTLFEALVFCNWLRTILTFFNSVKICEVKECKIDKHMELGLYRQPVINFQRPKQRGQARECKSKSKCWKNSASTTACFLSTSGLSFAAEQLSTLSTFDGLF